MIIDILTLFPDMFQGIINSSIIARAIDNGIVKVNIHDFRDFSSKSNKRVDDYSYGGGAGMIIEVSPVVECLRSIEGFTNAKKIITLPTGSIYNQKKASELAKEKHIVIVCGHYEGIDNRIMNYVDEAISIGDYILTGGEVAAITIIDSIIRLLPNALGNSQSVEIESFDGSLLEYPQYTRPVDFEGVMVPDVLISGNHEHIRRWRRFQSLKITYEKRPDLLLKADLTKEDLYYLHMIKNNIEFNSDIFKITKFK